MGRRSGTCRGKLDAYVEHRLDRERRLLAALERGLRERGRAAGRGVGRRAGELRPFAAASLRAHLEKLRAEGRA